MAIDITSVQVIKSNGSVHVFSKEGTMTHIPGKVYDGPGKADPSKTRAERKAELQQLLQSPKGKDVVEYYFALYTGMFEGKCPPVGVLVIETILNHEYPSTVATSH